MAKAFKSRASKQDYLSPVQLILAGFESPFNSKNYERLNDTSVAMVHLSAIRIMLKRF
jgi:hypothetical protein